MINSSSSSSNSSSMSDELHPDRATTTTTEGFTIVDRRLSFTNVFQSPNHDDDDDDERNNSNTTTMTTEAEGNIDAIRILLAENDDDDDKQEQGGLLETRNEQQHCSQNSNKSTLNLSFQPEDVEDSSSSLSITPTINNSNNNEDSNSTNSDDKGDSQHVPPSDGNRPTQSATTTGLKTWIQIDQRSSSSTTPIVFPPRSPTHVRNHQPSQNNTDSQVRSYSTRNEEEEEAIFVETVRPQEDTSTHGSKQRRKTDMSSCNNSASSSPMRRDRYEFEVLEDVPTAVHGVMDLTHEEDDEQHHHGAHHANTATAEHHDLLMDLHMTNFLSPEEEEALNQYDPPSQHSTNYLDYDNHYLDGSISSNASLAPSLQEKRNDCNNDNNNKDKSTDSLGNSMIQYYATVLATFLVALAFAGFVMLCLSSSNIGKVKIGQDKMQQQQPDIRFSSADEGFSAVAEKLAHDNQGHLNTMLPIENEFVSEVAQNSYPKTTNMVDATPELFQHSIDFESDNSTELLMEGETMDEQMFRAQLVATTKETMDEFPTPHVATTERLQSKHEMNEATAEAFWSEMMLQPIRRALDEFGVTTPSSQKADQNDHQKLESVEGDGVVLEQNGDVPFQNDATLSQDKQEGESETPHFIHQQRELLDPPVSFFNIGVHRVFAIPVIETSKLPFVNGTMTLPFETFSLFVLATISFLLCWMFRLNRGHTKDRTTPANFTAMSSAIVPTNSQQNGNANSTSLCISNQRNEFSIYDEVDRFCQRLVILNQPGCLERSGRKSKFTTQVMTAANSSSYLALQREDPAMPDLVVSRGCSPQRTPSKQQPGGGCAVDHMMNALDTYNKYTKNDLRKILGVGFGATCPQSFPKAQLIQELQARYRQFLQSLKRDQVARVFKLLMNQQQPLRMTATTTSGYMRKEDMIQLLVQIGF